MKFIIVIAFALSISLFSFSQNFFYTKPDHTPDVVKGALYGIITDAKTGMPLKSASVYIADLKTGTITDAKGSFEITNIPEGRHLVEVSFIGYSTVAEYVEIFGSIKKDFVLTESVVENNAVVVTGTSSATKIRHTPTPVSIVSKSEMMKAVSFNLIEALAGKPGVSAVTTGPAIAKPVLRGLGYNRVVVINDGVRQEGQQWGDEHGIEIDEASVQKVEILKGPGSVIYGSDAMAGVINIISNVPLPDKTMSLKYQANYQTNNRLMANYFSWGANIKGFNWNFYLSSKAAADYRNKYDDYVFNSKFKENNFGGYAGFNGNKGYSHFIISSFNSTTGIVEGSRDDNGLFTKPVAGGGSLAAVKEDFLSKNVSRYFPHQQIRHLKLALDNSIKLGKGKINFNLAHQQNKREEFGNVDVPEERELFFDLQTQTYTAQYLFPEKNNWKLTLGINGMQQKNNNKGEEQLIPDYRLNDNGIYFYVRKSVKKITVSAGTRYDIRNLDAVDLLGSGGVIKTAGFSKTFSNFSGSIGATFEANENLNLKFNVAKGFRAPSVSELASNGNHEGTLRYEYGRQNLQSENSIQLDGGFDFTTDHLSFTAAVFYNSFSNFIFYQKLAAVGGGDSLININGQDLTAFQFGQNKAALSGLELTFDFHPHPLDWLHFENTISFVNGRFKNPIELSTNMPLIPAGRWISELRADYKKAEGTPMHNLYFKAVLDNTFAQESAFTPFNTETKTPGYSLLNIGAGTDFTNKKGNTFLSLHVAVNNITDVAYQNHLSRLKYADENKITGRRGVFNMGRNYSIKLLMPLTFNVKVKE